jgi:REP element-mobilizing transposase RayT
MRRQTQLSFEGFKRPSDKFGGALLKNSHAKSKRPLETKFAIHLVLTSVEGKMRLPKNFKNVGQIVKRVCKKYGVRIYEFVNVGNHIHLLIRILHVWRWGAFIRELTGRIAQVVQGINGQEKGIRKFWKQRPFTRIVRGWGKAFRIAKEYIELNRIEALGYISRKDVKTLRDLRLLIGDG